MRANIQHPGHDEGGTSDKLLRDLQHDNRGPVTLTVNFASCPMIPEEDRNDSDGVVEDMHFSTIVFKVGLGRIPKYWWCKMMRPLAPLNSLCDHQHLISGEPSIGVAHKFSSLVEVCSLCKSWWWAVDLVMSSCKYVTCFRQGKDTISRPILNLRCATHSKTGPSSHEVEVLEAGKINSNWMKLPSLTDIDNPTLSHVQRDHKVGAVVTTGVIPARCEFVPTNLSLDHVCHVLDIVK